MIGLGTAINMGLIIGGSIIGLTCGRFMKENLKQTLMVVCGIIVLLLGDERGYAIYAGHRQWFPPNNGATIDDY